MENKYSKIVAREIKEATFELYGGIGDTINGDYLAKEINYQDKYVDQHKFRINSLGGNVLQGLSIVSAIVGAKAKTIGVIEGIAGSMAGFIALACSHVSMNDFARLMLHSPYYKNENGRVDNLTEEEKVALENLKGIIVDLLTRRGKTKEEIEKILETDTWYTAEQAKAEGFIDEIIDTGVAEAALELSIDKLVAFTEDTFLSINKNSDMKKIAAKLGLPETADELAIVAAIDQAQDAVKTERTKLVEAVIAAGKKSGTVTAQNEAQMRRLATADLDLCIDLVMKPAEASDNTRLSDVIAKLAQLKGEGTEDKNWDWYQKNDSEALAEMKTKDPVKYKKLYEEYWKQELK